MADQITMAKYWHQYQAAEIKANRARVELEKLKTPCSIPLDRRT